RAGLLAGLLFLGLGLGAGAAPPGALLSLLLSGPAVASEHPSPAWSALYKEDLLGIALSVGAVAILAQRRSIGTVVLAGALAGLAILTKQTFVAASLAGAWWLWRLDRRLALIFAAVDLGLVLVTSLGFELATGAYLQN